MVSRTSDSNMFPLCVITVIGPGGMSGRPTRFAPVATFINPEVLGPTTRIPVSAMTARRAASKPNPQDRNAEEFEH